MGRGIEIHNGYASIPNVQSVSLGTPTATIDQTTPNSIEAGVAKSIKATTGVEKGFDALLKTGAAGSQCLVGLHTKISAITALAVTGYAIGLHTEIEVLGTATLGSADNNIVGAKIEISAEATTTISSTQIYGLLIRNYILSAPEVYIFIRCDENGDQTIQACLYFMHGGTGAVNYFLHLRPNIKEPGWSSLGNKAVNPNGYLKVRMHNTDRYIQLYEGA